MAWDDIPDWVLAASRSILQAVLVKDAETYHHCVRVSRGSRLLAEAAGLNDYEARLCEYAGLFHDIGKVGIPDGILLKPAKLTDVEYEMMKSHPVLSAAILEPLSGQEFVRKLLPGVLHHHERVDGRGYPHGLEGDKIPLEARVVLIADTFDAMTAHRAYRQGLPLERVHQELRDFAGRQFDASLVKIFLEASPGWKQRELEVAREQEHAAKILPFPGPQKKSA